MAGYTRQSTYTDGDIIQASDSNDEFDQLVNAFANTTGHKHDGTAGEGPVIGVIGDAGDTTPQNKIEINTSNNTLDFYINVGGTATKQVVIQDGAVLPVTDDDIDLGSASAKFKDAYFDGTVNADAAVIDSVTFTSGTAITSVDTDLSSVSASDDTLASAKAIKTYIDAQVTAQDLDFAGDTGTGSIDLDSESLTLTGGTGITSAVSGNQVTFDIDSTVATLTGAQTLTNKTINADNNTVSNLEVDNLKSGVLDTDLNAVAGTDTTIPSAKAVKDYVDSQVTAQDLDFAGDTGTGSIDLDSETLTFTGGTGLTSSVSGNTVTLGIDSSVATLTGTQTLTNKTINGSNNTLSDIGNSSLTNSSVTINGTGLSLGGSLTLDTGDIGEGSNLYYTQARFDTAFGNKSTSDLSEGTNLYYTQARFNTAFGAKSTTDLSEGTNLYYTTARVNSAFDTRLATKDTDDLAEGTNLYYTTARANSAIDARVDKTFVDNLNVDADTLDGIDSTGFDAAGTALALSIALG